MRTNYDLINRMRGCSKLLSHLLATFVLSMATAWAVPITFEMGGEITRVDSPLANTFYVGKKFTLTYTFDSQTPNDGIYAYFLYQNAISKLTLTSGDYSVFANNGTIELDLWDGASYSAKSTENLNGPTIAEQFTPQALYFGWDGFGPRHNLIPEIDAGGPPERPGFSPDISPATCFDCTYYDADGNVVYDPVNGNPNPLEPPLFYGNGTLVPVTENNGVVRLQFINAAGQTHSIVGRFIFGRVVPNPVDDYLVAHWPLHDSEGVTAFDHSGNQHNGSIHNDPEWNGNILHFPGTNGYIDAGTFDVPGQALTLTAWVKSEDFANCNYNGGRIITKSYNTSDQAQYWLLNTVLINNETHLRFSLKTNGTTSNLYGTADDLRENEWFHVAAVYDGSYMVLYKNGNEVGRLAKTGSINTDNTIPVWIGGNPYYGERRPWKGNISNVRVYQKALTADEIKAIRDDDKSSLLN